MRGFTSFTVLLLCSHSWMSESHTVESGDEVTLMCSNISTSPTLAEWFRVVNRTKPRCISAMYGADGTPSFCDGFQMGKYEMTSNITTVFLKIKQVDISDAGLYFCGFYIKHTLIANSTELRNDESDDEGDLKTADKPDTIAYLMSMILGGLTVLLTIVVLVQAVKIWKLQKAVNGESQTEKSENLRSDDVNYAAVTFQTRLKRHHGPAAKREMETHVVYAATR
uniref:Ig-like domain-containing protein n=1 Tax=Amphiprion percula TaxID=161767 RepID=A0A3P8TIX7_AMPPE